MKLRILCFLTVVTAAMCAHATVYTYQASLFYSPNNLVSNNDPCLSNPNQACNITNLAPGTNNATDTNTFGFADPVTQSQLPANNTYFETVIKVSNYLLGTENDTNSGNVTSSIDYTFRDTSNLKYTALGSNFYQVKLFTEEVIATVAANGGNYMATEWANDVAGATVGGVDTVDGSTSPNVASNCNLSNGTNSPCTAQVTPGANLSDFVPVNDAAHFNTVGAVPIFWSGAANGISDANGDQKHAYAGVRIEVDYLYTLPNGNQPSVPEPATLLLLGSGLSFVAAKLRRRAVR